MILTSLFLLTISCKKENTEPSVSTDLVGGNTGFKAQITMDNASKKSWQTASAIVGTTSPVAGVDYFANRGGINPEELTLMSFGKFTDDPSGDSGRLTIFLSGVTNIGTYKIGGSSTSYAVLTFVNGNVLENYSTDQNDQGSVVISKYDTQNSIISGTFSFQAISGSKTINVDNGVFADVPFKQ
jgi:hypothetical protein